MAVTQTARDAMVPEPTMLEGGASAQEAGRALANPDVRAVFVTDEGGRLLGVITRKTLVREVVARGLDPQTTTVRDIAEEPHHTLDASLELDLAFRFVEEHDLERVPVVEADGRLVGVLSRAVVRRRLAEDEPPGDPELETAPL